MSPRITRARAPFAFLAVFAFLAACTHVESRPTAPVAEAALATVDTPRAVPVAGGPQHAAPVTQARQGLSLLPTPVAESASPSPLLAKVLADPTAGDRPAAGIPMTPQPGASGCGDDMVLVDGEYCTEVEQTCIDWMEPPQPGGIGRCRKFAPSVCKGQREHMKFCIDKDEYTPPGDVLPENYSSWTTATEQCGKLGKRLCEESEWNFAGEGEDMLPYPTGYERASDKCNYDQMHLYDARGAVKDLRQPSASLTECMSPFGVRNMAGNVDEWTNRDVTWGEHKNAMKGGWWMARNRCRPATISHGDIYIDFQTGFRCCEDAK